MLKAIPGSFIPHQSFDETFNTSDSHGQLKQILLAEEEDDEAIILSSLGYKSELRRRIGAFQSLSFGLTNVSTASSISIAFGYGLVAGTLL